MNPSYGRLLAPLQRQDRHANLVAIGSYFLNYLMGSGSGVCDAKRPVHCLC